MHLRAANRDFETVKGCGVAARAPDARETSEYFPHPPQRGTFSLRAKEVAANKELAPSEPVYLVRGEASEHGTLLGMMQGESNFGYM